MAARIVVQNGSSAGAEHWIEKSVVRIGSHPSSDMIIPSTVVDAHMLTVESRDFEFRVYNRGTKQVFVGGRLVEQNEFAVWPDTDLLELPDGFTLALDLEDNAAAKAASYATPYPSDVAGGSASSVSNSSKAPALINDSVDHALGNGAADPASMQSKGLGLQLIVIALCIVGCVLLLVRHQLKAEEKPSRPAPSFDSVLRSAIEPNSGFPPAQVSDLQLAEAAYLRKQPEAASIAFRTLHDQLTRSLSVVDDSSPSDETAVDDPIVAALNFVEHRLRQLAE